MNTQDLRGLQGRNGQNIRNRTFEFACNVVTLAEGLLARYGAGRIMATQLVNCSTSAAAMLEEAKAAESRRDFVSKCSIALKELREAWVRLRICARTQRRFKAELDQLVSESNQLVAIVTAILRNTRARWASRERA